MAYQFAQSPSHSYLRTANAPAFTDELVISLWFKAADVTNLHTLVKIEFDDPDNNRLMVQARGDVAGDPVRLVSQNENTQYEVLSTGSYTANVWQHVMVATGFSLGSKMWISLNGAAWVAKSSVKGPNGSPSYIQIGGDGVFIPSTIGSVAEVALWEALSPYTAFDPQGLGKPLTQGFAPSLFFRKPVFYAPLIRGLQDTYGGRTLTAYNSPVPANDHPPMRLPYAARNVTLAPPAAPEPEPRTATGGALLGCGLVAV